MTRANSRPAAVLWDFDGTLVDTEPYWIEAEFELVGRYGGTWTREHALNLVGNDLLVSGRYIREHAGIDLEPAVIVEELLDGVVARVQEAVPAGERRVFRSSLSGLGPPGLCEIVAGSRPGHPHTGDAGE